MPIFVIFFLYIYFIGFKHYAKSDERYEDGKKKEVRQRKEDRKRREKEREKKLDDLSVQLLTCVTILSVAFLTPASFLFECYATTNSVGLAPAQIKLAWMYAIVLAPLVVCIILTLCARSLRQMEVLDSPESQAAFINRLHNEDTADNSGDCIDDLTVAQNYCDAIQGTFEGMRKKHDTMWKLIKISMTLVIFSCGCALLFGLHLLLQLA